MALVRILDAAANRTREGLRVLEDWARFALDDAQLTACLKQVRHDLAAALAGVPWEQRLAARDTEADVGTEIHTSAEFARDNVSEVLAANFLRVQEGLRSLEEFGKVLDPAIGQAIGQLRYRAYTLQRAVDETRVGCERLAVARLYVLLDGRESIVAFETLVRQLIKAGVDVLQLRDKRLSDRELIDRARLLRMLTEGTSTLLVINDRPDIAALVRADGVHVGQDELSVKDVRSIVGPDMLVGVSTHSIEQARQAVLDGANYIGVGPTFASGTKQFEHFPGVELLRAVAAEIRLPAFAIGGITHANVEQVRAAGFTRIAVSGAVIEAGDPCRAAQELLAFL
jgi:thiamine-phosphate pyrophosphorylase